jgi:hypothetical protein
MARQSTVKRLKVLPTAFEESLINIGHSHEIDVREKLELPVKQMDQGSVWCH